MIQNIRLDVPIHWEIASLQELCGKGAYGSGASAVEFDERKPRYIRITDINDNGQLNDSKVSPSTGPDDWAKNSLEDGDLLFARSGATVGKTFLYDSSYGYCVYAGYLIRFRPDKKRVSPRYLYHFTKTPVYESWVLAQQKTVAQPNINAKQYGNELPIPLPPLAEQQRIAAILDKADALRAKRRAALAKLDTLLQSIFLDMFGDPVTNPKGWRVIELDDVIKFRTGKLDSNAAVEGGQYPFFTCAREVYQIDHYAFDEEVLLMAGNNASADYWVKHYKGPFNAYQRTYVMTLKLPTLSYKYTRLAMEYKLEELKRISKGTNTRYLTLGLLKPLQVQIPSNVVMKQFDIVHDQLVAEQQQMELGLLSLDNLFNSLQQRAFKGEL